MRRKSEERHKGVLNDRMAHSGVFMVWNDMEL
jgi:hypothetical protein